ncbi:VanZ family protein [Sediminicurvatus halobius]|uniref:VanZ-like domain-containing protein n=1 Tax=Sediminicurvatus halobius TaxID=2182432 RepID=A0A2U2MX51_9GAMM|nr:VanZ family protein [Spiribacter halobius]PWG61445.1 hypothetical protein DEM34_16230 [Spiribacter halobius]UEX77230.1 VanZ family protein [Spiribacter halobius]
MKTPLAPLLLAPHRREPAWLAPAAAVLGILALASIPGVPAEEVEGRFSIAALPPTLQNALHIPLYGIITWVWLRALHHVGQRATHLGLAATAALATGLLDELRQGFVPGRYASLTDMALNAAGILLALLLWHGLTRQLTPR